MNDDPKAASRLHIRSSREQLYQVQLNYVHLDELLKVLLRSYGGLFTDYVYIKDDEIMERSGLDARQFQKNMQQLQDIGVVDYIRNPGMPQLIFCQNRVEEKYIAIHQENYLQQKANALKRLDAVIEYVSLSNHCRSKMLLSYFGEKDAKPCAQCDVSLKANKAVRNEKNFSHIKDQIVQVLSIGELPLQEVLMKVRSHPGETVLKVINWMIENEEIKINAYKILSLNR